MISTLEVMKRHVDKAYMNESYPACVGVPSSPDMSSLQSSRILSVLSMAAKKR